MYGLTPFGGTGFGLWDPFNDFDKNFFGGSVKSMLNYFVSEEKLSQDEIKELLESVSKS